MCLISNARSTPTYNRIRVRVPFPRPFFRTQRDPSIAASSKFARVLVARKEKETKMKKKHLLLLTYPRLLLSIRSFTLNKRENKR